MNSTQNVTNISCTTNSLKWWCDSNLFLHELETFTHLMFSTLVTSRNILDSVLSGPEFTEFIEFAKLEWVKSTHLILECMLYSVLGWHLVTQWWWNLNISCHSANRLFISLPAFNAYHLHVSHSPLPMPPKTWLFACTRCLFPDNCPYPHFYTPCATSHSIC